MNLLDLTEDAFEVTSKKFNKEILPAGRYILETVTDQPYVNVSQAGNRSFTVAFRAVSDATAGTAVSGALIKERFNIDGSQEALEVTAKRFASLMAAYGIDEKGAARTMLQNAYKAIEELGEISDGAKISLTSPAGDSFNPKGRQVTASIKVEEHNDRVSNKISSVWAVKP